MTRRWPGSWRIGGASRGARALRSDRSVAKTLCDVNGHRIARALTNRIPKIRFDWQLVRSVAKRHERAPERMAVYRASDFYQAPRPEEVERGRR
jgi:hypothetical protein